MSFTFTARADWRALTAAALIGSGLGLGLGAGYMIAGLGADAAQHARAQQAERALVVAYEGPASALPATTPADLSVEAPLRRTGGPQARAADLECLTAAVYYEARGETPSGQAAVAQVVLNRVRHPAFPKTVCGVVYQGAGGKGCQFSFACNGARHEAREVAAWKRARKVAIRALSGVRLAEIGAATHFHTTGVSPHWGPRLLRVSQVGLHVFYRLGPQVARPAYARAEPAARVVFASFAPTEAADQPAPEIRLSMALLEPAAETPAAPPKAEAPAPAETPAPVVAESAPPAS